MEKEVIEHKEDSGRKVASIILSSISLLFLAISVLIYILVIVNADGIYEQCLENNPDNQAACATANAFALLGFFAVFFVAYFINLVISTILSYVGFFIIKKKPIITIISFSLANMVLLGTIITIIISLFL